MNVKGFLHWVVDQTFDGHDVDGGDLQEKLFEFGLLESVVVTEACGEGCFCARDIEMYGGKFPALCYKKTEWSKE